MSLSIRAKTYRGHDGFVVYGRNTLGQKISIFAQRRETAEFIRTQVRNGEKITTGSWWLDPGGVPI